MTRDSFVHSVDYNKKKEKKAQIKFIKDETVPRNDTYKSHTVHVPSGESPSSQSRPVPKKKGGVVRPITQGKLLRKGGPSAVSRYTRFLVRLLIIRLPETSCFSAEACIAATARKGSRCANAQTSSCSSSRNSSLDKIYCRSPRPAAAAKSQSRASAPTT